MLRSEGIHFSPSFLVQRKKMNSKSKSLIATNLMYKNNISANMRINILIGCLTINERDDFIYNFN